MIDFDLYKVFVVVANERNISKASSILDISPATINKDIKTLEKILKFKLFKKVDSNLLLTQLGNKLYKKLKNPIDELFAIEDQFNGIKNINIGSHSRLLDKIFNNCIYQFNLEYTKVNLNFTDLDTDEMLRLLSEKSLDIVFSKKVTNLNYSNLKFIKIGYLNDVFIADIDSDLSNKFLNINDLKNEIIYTPKSYSQTVARLLELIDIQELNLKCSNYDNILETITSSHSIGLVTKEYLDKEDVANYDLIELKTDLNLKPIEFGIYLSDSKFKELNDLVRVIKSYFFFRDF